MRRIITMLAVLMAVASVVSLAQVTGTVNWQWQFVKFFPDTTTLVDKSLGGHGVAVDPDGKVWVQMYGTTDSIAVGGGKYARCRVIYCFNPNGTQASFSPIKTVTVGAVTDTLWNSNRGMEADHDGNIVFASYDALYKLNYKTGAGMAKGQPYPGNTLIKPAFDAANDVFCGFVIPKGPIFILNPADLSLVGNAVDSASGYSRVVEVSDDANTIYWTAYTNSEGVQVYTSANGTLGPYALGAPIGGLYPEGAGWCRKTGAKLLYIGSGDGVTSNPTMNRSKWGYYGYDPATHAIRDSIFWNGANATLDPRPRGIAFSPAGDTAYLCQFNAGSISAIQMFKRVARTTAVEPVDNGVVKGYALSQNYPNPFNPTTQIQFSVGKAGFTTLRVYDVLGREVATLVNQEMNVGAHTVTFDASSLTSGTYLYELRSGDVRLVNKMVLMK